MKPDNLSTTLYSVSEDLLCAFELLKPLDGPALRKEMSKVKRKRYVYFFSGFKMMVTYLNLGILVFTFVIS